MRLTNEFGEGSGVIWPSAARPVVRSMDVLTRWWFGDSKTRVTFIGVARMRGMASSRMCPLVCANSGLLGEYRKLALEMSLLVLSVLIGNGVPRSDADLAT